MATRRCGGGRSRTPLRPPRRSPETSRIGGSPGMPRLPASRARTYPVRANLQSPSPSRRRTRARARARLLLLDWHPASTPSPPPHRPSSQQPTLRTPTPLLQALASACRRVARAAVRPAQSGKSQLAPSIPHRPPPTHQPTRALASSRTPRASPSAAQRPTPPGQCQS